VGSHEMLMADEYDASKKETLDLIRDLIQNSTQITVPNGDLQ
jgi:hypothetical protein